MKKIKDNKIIKIISNILYTIIFLIVLLMLIIVILQRTSNNEVSLGGYRIFVVVTGSMKPKYEEGDVLISKEFLPENIEIGDDVVYSGKEGNFKGKIVTHQVISKENENGEYKFITKGIANTAEDPEITQEQIKGKVIYKIKALSLFEKIALNNYAFYFIIFIPIALIIFRQIRNINHDEDDEEIIEK